MEQYDHSKIEKKWQKNWASKKIYRTRDDSAKKKFYVLDMFPYPSGEGLHVGHPKGYIATDIVSRMKRMQGHEVLHPMGFDAFGLPAENYAIKMKTNPADAVKKNVAHFKEQLENIGFDYDWTREVNTTDPEYYKWTQWIFVQLFKRGLAYESFEPINWCPVDKTGLANEDVEDGKCERCGTPVEKKMMRQWILKITDYADRMLKDLDAKNRDDIPHLVDRKNPPLAGKKSVERKTVHALVVNPKNGKILCIKWKKFPWTGFVIGGVEEGEDIVEAARREVLEETGYKNLKFIRVLGGIVKGEYYAAHKGENRVAYSNAIHFELIDDAQAPIGAEEKAKHAPVWLDPKKLNHDNFTCAELDVWMQRLNMSDAELAKIEAAADKPLLDWPESIKELQKNWIGRSEGVNFMCKIKDLGILVEMYNSVPQTYCAETFTVIAPEHPLVAELIKGTKNEKAVLEFVEKIKAKKAANRFDIDKDMEGMFTGRYIENFAGTGRDLPIWIASYVLADYGTGMVNCSAHDERDYAFAKKYDLPLHPVAEKLIKTTEGEDAVRPEAPYVERNAVMCVVKHWSEDKYLCLSTKAVDWKGFVIGGIEGNEGPAAAGVREIVEETGYANPEFVKILGGKLHAQFYHIVKKENRFAHFQPALFKLKNGDRKETSESEKALHDAVWLSSEEVSKFLNREALVIAWNRAHGIEDKPPVKNGILTEPAEFAGREWSEVRSDIIDHLVQKGYATRKVNYKLRPWVFSRQRYWGEPIPIIHCEKCGIVAVPEKDLPVKLPRVKFYEPTGTGESPLAAIEEWVNVKCPQCKGLGKRETNTMPQWAGSCWYYLRYMDPKNKKTFADSKKEHYWAPVDLYVGGAEHATRHLIYARFWHKFLYDIGVVTTIEPFKKLQHVGLIMAEDGRKMSKRWGNVVNPDEIIKNIGADSLRVYEMFIGPFDQQAAWSTNNAIGSRRFIERVWRLQEKVTAAEIIIGGNAAKIEALIHKTIKKVTEDIDAMRFNTAISTMMIAVNELERETTVSKGQYETLLKLLAPFAPHVADEIWQAKLKHKESIHVSAWPVFDAAKLAESTVEIIVQVNGKVRATFESETNAGNTDLEARALAISEIKKWIGDKPVKKVIIVKGRLVNVVI
ncbi:MAG: leucyl-tRNA synthetase [Candidatus Taylorbacteria bacterium]|nr:leucyl-tRNA synthetase [Candidatus Taylorbacteria bacterium]